MHILANQRHVTSLLCGTVMQRSTWTMYHLWSDTRHLFDTWEKNRRPEFDTFSPGPEYHFARNSFFPQAWRLGPHHLFPVVKERPGIRHQCYWLQIHYIHTELVLWTFLETDKRVGLTSFKSVSASSKPPALWSYPCIAHLRGLRRPTFCIRRADNMTDTCNSTGIRQKWKQSVPRNLRRIIWVGWRLKIDGEKIFGSSGFAVNSTSNSRRPLARDYIDHCMKSVHSPRSGFACPQDYAYQPLLR
jgi:hypothetical protein